MHFIIFFNYWLVIIMRERERERELKNIKKINILIKYTLCLFRWRTFCKDSFPHFPMFGSTKKTWSMENYLWSTENSNKNKAYFL